MASRLPPAVANLAEEVRCKSGIFADGKLAKNFAEVHSDSVLGLEFSKDGKYIASASADKFVKVTDIATGKVVHSFEGHTHHATGTLAGCRTAASS